MRSADPENDPFRVDLKLKIEFRSFKIRTTVMQINQNAPLFWLLRLRNHLMGISIRFRKSVNLLAVVERETVEQTPEQPSAVLETVAIITVDESEERNTLKKLRNSQDCVVLMECS
jgi:hypothetical protein